MNFSQTLHLYFKNAVREADFGAQTPRILQAKGFLKTNTLACIGLCRDEISTSLATALQDTWGETFNFSSLAGMLFVGKTGFSAAHDHAPIVAGPKRYLYCALPHIAIDADGEIGRLKRPGQDQLSVACGALSAFHQEMSKGGLSLEFDPDDVEQSLLKQKLAKQIQGPEMPDLVALTELTYQTILADLERMIKLTVDPQHSAYAVLTSIHIHGPQENFVWPGKMYASIQGEVRPILVN